MHISITNYKISITKSPNIIKMCNTSTNKKYISLLWNFNYLLKLNQMDVNVVFLIKLCNQKLLTNHAIDEI